MEQIIELKAIIQEIKEQFDTPIITVYLHHHPLKFNFRPELMKLKDKEAFLTAIRGIHVLLFGHLHHNQRFANDEIKYDINCIQLSGGSTHGLRIDWTEIDTETFETAAVVF